MSDQGRRTDRVATQFALIKLLHASSHRSKPASHRKPNFVHKAQRQPRSPSLRLQPRGRGNAYVAAERKFHCTNGCTKCGSSGALEDFTDPLSPFGMDRAEGPESEETLEKQGEFCSGRYRTRICDLNDVNVAL